MQNWLLPEYIQDMLPDEAWRVENMRRAWLELLQRAGYQLVAPPLLEYAESLLLHGSSDMDLRSFKLVDQLSGRTLALRADMTPQAARMDAHLLNRQGITRLCYAGSVLHTQPVGLTRTRELLQLGAELYGCPGLQGDIEIQQLLLQSLALLGIENVHLDLGHVGVFRALVADLDSERETALFSALQSKDSATLRTLVQDLAEPTRSALLALPTLYGEVAEVLARARQVLPANSAITQALDELSTVAGQLNVASLGIDLADLRGYHYHSGMVFAAYHPGSHDAIALGGRYDELGKSFGRARAATGFSMDLRQLYRLLPGQSLPAGILAPHRDDAALQAKIAALRAAGDIVVVDLLNDATHHAELNCDRQLLLQDGIWQVAKR